MTLLNFFRRRGDPSASIAKERLQIVLAHERAGRAAPDFLPKLQKEVLAVVAKFVNVSDDMIKVQLEKVGETSVLEINIEFDRAREKPDEPSNDRAPAADDLSAAEPVAKEA